MLLEDVVKCLEGRGFVYSEFVPEVGADIFEFNRSGRVIKSAIHERTKSYYDFNIDLPYEEVTIEEFEDYLDSYIIEVFIGLHGGGKEPGSGASLKGGEGK